VTEVAPTPDELLAMSYVDGELKGAARSAFEARLCSEPALALEVTELRRLELAARLAAPADPLDIEWRRLRTDRLQRVLHVVGTVLIALSACHALSAVLRSAPFAWDGPWKLVAIELVCGAALIGAATLRARLRTRALDPYTATER
jgi:anti-sigma factor RsiW